MAPPAGRAAPPRTVARGGGRGGQAGGPVRCMGRAGAPGAFVYQAKGSGRARAGADVCELRCKRLACAIQRCIATARPGAAATGGLVDFKKACSIEIAKFDKCCERAKAAEAAEAAEAAAGAGAAGAAARAAAAGGR